MRKGRMWLIATTRRFENRTKRKRTQTAHLISHLFLALLVLAFVGRYELIVLHPNKPQELLGIMCDDEDAANFLERNFRKSYERGRLMYRIHRARTRRQVKQARKGKKYAQVPSFCRFDLWQVETNNLKILFRHMPAIVPTFVMKPVITELGVFSVSITGHVLIGDFQEKHEGNRSHH